MHRSFVFQLLLICGALAVFAGNGSAQARRAEPGAKPAAYTGILIRSVVKLNPADLKANPALDSPEIGSVIKGSPADSAGLKVGDVILEVNGEDPRNQRPIAITEPQLGETYVLRIRRGNSELEVLLVAAPRPPDLPSGKELWERERNKTGS